jgi:hypothetical protein
MVKVCLNDAEQAVLDDLDYIYEALYRRGIRRYMDFSSGNVGTKRGISWQSLKESLYVEPRRGVQRSRPILTRSSVRRLAEHLERVGLISIKSRGKHLIFECILADKDYCVKNKAAQKPAYKADIKGGQPKKLRKLVAKPLIEGKQEKDGTYVALQENSKADTPPDTGNIYIYNKHIVHLPLSDEIIERIFEEKFWQHYPRKENRKKAFDVFKRKKLYTCADQLFEDINKRKKDHRPWTDGYIPHATTYLNGERWNDEIQEVRYGNSNQRIGGKRGETVRAVIESCFNQTADDEV